MPHELLATTTTATTTMATTTTATTTTAIPCAASQITRDRATKTNLTTEIERPHTGSTRERFRTTATAPTPRSPGSSPPSPHATEINQPEPARGGRTLPRPRHQRAQHSTAPPSLSEPAPPTLRDPAPQSLRELSLRELSLRRRPCATLPARVCLRESACRVCLRLAAHTSCSR